MVVLDGMDTEAGELLMSGQNFDLRHEAFIEQQANELMKRVSLTTLSGIGLDINLCSEIISLMKDMDAFLRKFDRKTDMGDLIFMLQNTPQLSVADYTLTEAYNEFISQMAALNFKARTVSKPPWERFL